MKQWIALVGCVFSLHAFAQTQELLQDSIPGTSIELKAIVIEYGRAVDKTPMSYVDIKKKDIAALNNGQDVPFVLRFTPSLVVTSDAGNGIGYTGLWIRGTDPSRINVTINGIPLNDPESQQVFWVNTPDFISSVGNIQVQRGVGTSSNGVASFGGAIKMDIDQFQISPFATVRLGMGSFNTHKQTIQFGSGRINQRFAIEGRLSQLHSDGYIDRARTDLKGYLFAGEWYQFNGRITFTTFGGNEETYQSWYGTPAELLEGGGDQSLIDFAGRNRLNHAELNNLLNSDRRYNYYTYDNQIDKYAQHHYQLRAKHQWSSAWFTDFSLHYTRGRGYFEEFKADDSRGDYGFDPLLVAQTTGYSDGVDEDGNPVNAAFIQPFTVNDLMFIHEVVVDENGNPILDANGNSLLNSSVVMDQTDVVRRRWLDNHFGGGTFNASRNFGDHIFTFGGAYSEYHGEHFGDIVWMENGQGVEVGQRYYEGRSVKRDGNVFVRGYYQINLNLSVYLDHQTRWVDYSTQGVDNDLRPYEVKDQLLFHNPKVGFSYAPAAMTRFYASVAIGNKEPNRNDYVDAPVGFTPRPERMIDYELGYVKSNSKMRIGVTAYYMNYKDQLVLTGELNDVGAALRTNVDRSFRRGIELEAAFKAKSKVELFANLTLSQNKIEKFNEVIYDYTNGFFVVNNQYENTDISFSPSTIGAAGASCNILRSYTPSNLLKHELEVTVLGKYVGRQFLDNTSDATKMINACTVMDARLTYRYSFNNANILELNLWVNNVLDRMYVSNGYTYSYIFEQKVTERFYYPQAGRNLMFGLVWSCF